MSVFDEVIDRRGTHCIKWDAPMFKNPDAVRMTIADMDWRSPQAVVDAVCEAARFGIYGYPLPSKPELTDTVLAWLKERNDWDVKPEQLGFAVRVVDLLAIAVCSMTKEGEAVITQTPLYDHFKSAIENAHRKLVSNRLVRDESGYHIDFDAFEREIVENDVKLYILCNPHNPCGRVWTPEELRKLVEICKAHNVVIVADEIHSDLVMPGFTYTPTAKIAAELGYDRVMTAKSPSKTFNLAGLQLGYYIASSPEIAEAIEGEKKYRSYPDLPNNFSTVATIAAYTQGAAWLDEVRAYIQQNYFTLRDWLAEHAPQASVAELQGTYLAWLDVSCLGITEDELKARIDEVGLGVSTTSGFGITDGLYLRMNIACPRATLNRALEALGRLLA